MFTACMVFDGTETLERPLHNAKWRSDPPKLRLRLLAGVNLVAGYLGFILLACMVGRRYHEGRRISLMLEH